MVLVDFGLSSSPDAAGAGGAARSASPRPSCAAGGRPVAGQRRLLAGRHRLRPAHRRAPRRASARRGTASTRRRPTSSRTAIRAGLATDPARRPATAGRARRAAAGRVGARRCRPACSRSASPTSRARPALWEAQPAAMARALVLHDELVADGRRAPRRPLPRSRWARATPTVSVFPAAADAVVAAIDLQRGLADRRPAGGDPAAASGPRCTPARPSSAAATTSARTLNVAARLRGLADGGQVFLSEATAALVARPLCPTACARRPRPAPARGDHASPSRSSPSSAPGVDGAAAGHRLPVPGPAGVRGGGRRPLLRSRSGRRRARRSTSARPRFVAVVGRQRERQVVGAAGRAAGPRAAAAPVDHPGQLDPSPVADGDRT